MCETIKVGMADLNVCKEPDQLITLGLGSCVGIVLYDTSTKISGMVHVMLPDSTKIKNNENKAKFADTGIQELLNNMLELGAMRSKIVAKIAGGAHMFTFGACTGEFMQVGERNVAAAKEILNSLKIDILAEDTGLNYGRTIVFDSVSGMLKIKAIGQEDKYI
ncbi:MAG: chemotaxis protein CheD [Lachnospiraceae bacterium]|nr:chemotaxis protein CheD [Lachnospiraceae bacterium]MBQ4069129.1 chemotaxis protein CheD [Lachnospiraceae bacterium]